MARTWKQKPSDIYNISDPYTAYCFNRAVMTWGLAYEEDLNKAAQNAKNSKAAASAIQVAHQRWMRDESLSAPEVQKGFKDPALMFASKKE